MTDGPSDHGGATEEPIERVRRLLGERGVDDRTIDSALMSGRIALLATERMAVPGAARFTPPEVAAATGLPAEVTAQLWRALGFPSVPGDEAAFTDLDLDALATLQRLMELGIADLDIATLLARVIGSSMARIAETEVGIETGRSLDADRLAFADAMLSASDSVLDHLADLLVYVWRRHLHAAARRAMAVERVDESGFVVPLSIGFADLVGYTALSQQLSDEALARLVSRFEETAHNTVTGGGGRVVKMIGDEVMFAVEDPAAAASIALTLADAFADDDVLSDVRVGLAHGPVLAQEGDYFGPVVNLASRLVNLAYPGTVVVSDDVHSVLADHPDLAWKSLRSRQVKGIGHVPLWVVFRPGGDPKTRRRPRGSLRTLLTDVGVEVAERRRE